MCKRRVRAARHFVCNSLLAYFFAVALQQHTIHPKTPSEVSMRKTLSLMLALTILSLLGGCTQETQNKLGRAVQNWTGTDGVLEIYAGEKLVRRFIKIDKITTATTTDSSQNRNQERPYRFGYGVLDENLNSIADTDEKKVYFEFSDYSTQYIFFEAPR
jgi:hypothetical protein